VGEVTQAADSHKEAEQLSIEKSKQSTPLVGADLPPYVHDLFGKHALANQEAVKWLAGALAGVGVTFGLASQGAKVGDLEGFERWGTLLVALGFLAVAVGIYCSFRVLTPATPHPDTIETEVLKRLRVWTLHHQALKEIAVWFTSSAQKSGGDARDKLVDQPRAPDEPLARSTMKQLGVIKAALDWYADTSEEPPEKSVIALHRDEVVKAADQVNDYLLFREVSTRVSHAKRAMVGAVLGAAVCLLALLFLQGRADENAEHLTTTPFGARAELSKKDVKSMTSALGSTTDHKCTPATVDQSVSVVVVGGTTKRPLVQLTEPGVCAARLRLSGPLWPMSAPTTTATTTAPLETPGLVELGANDAVKLAKERGGNPGDNVRCFPQEGKQVPGILLAGSYEDPKKVVVNAAKEGVVSCKATFLDPEPNTKFFPTRTGG
jgi:hypothetical protein